MNASRIVDMQRAKIGARLRKMLPEFVDDATIKAALADNPEAVSGLVVAHSGQRADVVLALRNAGAWRSVAVALKECWRHNHDALLERVGGSELRELFLEAGTRPVSLPPRVTIWRGGCAPLGSGPSWSLNRAVACWFATWRSTKLGRPPTVLRGCGIIAPSALRQRPQRGRGSGV